MPASKPTTDELNVATSSRERLLLSAKMLFAEHGYENTSTASIARTAGTSESQLVKHFGSKEGLLEAIFEWGWEHINAAVADAVKIEAPRERLLKLLQVIYSALDQDEEMKELMLLESRRTRREVRAGRGQMVLITDGYHKMAAIIDNTLEEMKQRGELAGDVKVIALRSAISGMFEGMIRDQMLAKRARSATPFTPADVMLLLDRMISSLK